MKTFLLLLVGLTIGLLGARADDKVIVHEWGTFTSLQDEQGQAIGGINVDDEPVPSFVGSVAIGAAPQYGSSTDYGFKNLGLPPYEHGKGWTSGDPRVTMRLETPVLYIYPPQGQLPQSVPPLEVHVDFHGGVLSQFYPHAEFSGLPTIKFNGRPEMDGKFPFIDKEKGITEETTTSLDWKGIQLGSKEKPVESDDKVWITPRETSAPVLQIKFSEPDFNKPEVKHDYVQAEHFLFYRGVGHLDSPLGLTLDSDDQADKRAFDVWSSAMNEKKFVVKTALSEAADIADRAVYSEAWLADIQADGSCAFRVISSFVRPRTQTKLSPLTEIPSNFHASSFSRQHLDELKSSMHDALVKEGLYSDEATAMLKTWELSYFKSPGLRFFYIVPRAWTDKVLPLKITGAPTEITRVMVGRIELITDAQKAALARLATGPCPDLAAVKKAALAALEKSKLPKSELEPYYRGEKPLIDLGIPIPLLVRDYLSLGRFRDALIVREQQQHPTAALAQFIKDNGLAPSE